MGAALSRLPHQCPVSGTPIPSPAFPLFHAGKLLPFSGSHTSSARTCTFLQVYTQRQALRQRVPLFFQKYTASVPDKKNFPLSHNFPMTLSGSIKILFSLPQHFSYGNRSHPHRRCTGLLERKPFRLFPPVLPKVLSLGWQDQRTVPALPRLPYAYRTPSLSPGTV